MNIRVDNQSSGVKAVLNGFNASEVQRKIEACQDGACGCSCDPEVMKRITSVDLRKNGASLELTVEGDVNAEMMEPMMQSCLIDSKEA